MKRSFALIDLGLRRGDVEFNQGFTLIELLVVIAIIAILAVVVVLTLNPGQLLMQGRDSNRMSDMASLQSALAYYLTDSAINGTTNLGTSNVIYVSIPDMAATTTLGTNCATVGLPTLPSGYSYHCAASSTYRMNNGTGWIPVNLSTMTEGAVLGSWPSDPINQASSRLYYTYMTNGTQYELTTALESSKYKLGGTNDAIVNDGATLSTVYTKGTNLALEPLDYGDNSLVGYWPLNEGSGTIAYDDSGNNATGSWSGTQAGTSGYYSAGKGNGYGWGGAFDGSTTYINAPALNIFNENAFTVAGWIYPTASKEDEGLFGACQSGTTDHCLHLAIRTGTPYMGFYADDLSGGSTTLNAWYYLAFTYTGGAGGTRKIYLNGVQIDSGVSSLGLEVPAGTTSTLGSDVIEGDMQGFLDGVRVYSRALSASEIQAMYNGGK